MSKHAILFPEPWDASPNYMELIFQHFTLAYKVFYDLHLQL